MDGKKFRGNHNKLPQMIDGVTSDENISQGFAKKFNHLFNVVGFDKNKLENIQSSVRDLIELNIQNRSKFSTHKVK